jgi:very-short-patch-repair endonuclease
MSGKDWLLTLDFSRQSNRAVDQHLAWDKDRLTALFKRVQSPIEAELGSALLATLPAITMFCNVIDGKPERDDQGFFISPQFPVGNYRADFCIFMHTRFAAERLILECDGHQYHERTSDQAEHDKKRDRAFVESGLQVMRFTGTEIRRDPLACAEQAVAHLTRRTLAAEDQALAVAT